MAVMAANAIDVYEPEYAEVLAERPLEWIEAEITTLAGHIAAVAGRLVVHRVAACGHEPAIRDRDQGHCRFLGCTSDARLQIHLRHEWSRGGPTSTPNLLLICRCHHKVPYERGWHATGDANDRLTFHMPDGRTVAESPPSAPATDHGKLATLAVAALCHLGER